VFDTEFAVHDEVSIHVEGWAIKTASNAINAAVATRPTTPMMAAIKADLGPGEQHPIKEFHLFK
jgi:hypothetical protein